jgi:hypothetical protein
MTAQQTQNITASFGRDNYFGDTFVGIVYDNDVEVSRISGLTSFFTRRRLNRAIKDYTKYGIRNV